MLTLTLNGDILSQRSSVCRGPTGCASDCRPFTGKCGNAVLSFPVCNYLKSLAGIRSHNRRPVLLGAAAEGLASWMALGRTKNVWDLFSVRKYDLSGPQARYRFHPHRRILGPQSYLPPATEEGKTGPYSRKAAALSHLAGEKRNQSGAEPEGTHGSCLKHLL